MKTLSEPAKIYFETLSEQEKELYKTFNVTEKGQLNKLCEDLFHNSQKEYRKGIQNNSIPSSIDYQQYSKLVSENKEKAINELAKLFSKEATKSRIESKRKHKNSEIAQKYNIKSGKDVEAIKNYEKATGKSILNKYARTGLHKDEYKERNKEQKKKDKTIGFSME